MSRNRVGRWGWQIRRQSFCTTWYQWRWTPVAALRRT